MAYMMMIYRDPVAPISIMFQSNLQEVVEEGYLKRKNFYNPSPDLVALRRVFCLDSGTF